MYGCIFYRGMYHFQGGMIIFQNIPTWGTGKYDYPTLKTIHHPRIPTTKKIIFRNAKLITPKYMRHWRRKKIKVFQRSGGIFSACSASMFHSLFSTPSWGPLLMYDFNQFLTGALQRKPIWSDHNIFEK